MILLQIRARRTVTRSQWPRRIGSRAAVNFQSQSRDRDNAAVFGSVELSREVISRVRLLHYPTRECRRVAVFVRERARILWNVRKEPVKLARTPVIEIKHYELWEW